MKTNVKMFVFLSLFFLVDTFLYFIWWTLTNGGWEPIGTAALAMLFLMSSFITFFLWKTDLTQGIVPEDNPLANIEDGESEVGFYSPWSWWPIFLGASGALAFASLAIDWWLFFIAVPIGLVGIVGFVFEYSRGQHAH